MKKIHKFKYDTRSFFFSIFSLIWKIYRRIDKVKVDSMILSFNGRLLFFWNWSGKAKCHSFNFIFRCDYIFSDIYLLESFHGFCGGSNKWKITVDIRTKLEKMEKIYHFSIKQTPLFHKIGNICHPKVCVIYGMTDAWHIKKRHHKSAILIFVQFELVLCIRNFSSMLFTIWSKWNTDSC